MDCIVGIVLWIILKKNSEKSEESGMNFKVIILKKFSYSKLRVFSLIYPQINTLYFKSKDLN